MKQARNFATLRSLRFKMILWAFMFVGPILLIQALNVHDSVETFDALMRSNITQTLTPYAAEIDATLSTARRYVATMNVDLSPLRLDNDGDPSTLQQQRKLGEDASEDLVMYPGIDAIFFYTGENIWFVQNYNRSYVQNNRASKALYRILADYATTDNIYQQGYMTFESDGHYYLFNAINVPGGIVGCWFDTSGLVQTLIDAELPGLSYAIFSDRQGHMLNNDFATPSEKQLASLLEPYYVSHLSISSALFELNVLWDRDMVFAPITQMHQSLLNSTLIAVLLFVIYILLLHISLIRPLNRLIDCIHGIRLGYPNPIAIRKHEDAEIANVYQALNTMIERVESLRIQMYEETLTKQKIQMQLFQLQMRPHFFLNALNTIISFARVRQYDMVQQMTMSLAMHCRYILYSPWYVTIDEELVYTQNFVDMQSTQHNERYRYLVHVEDELLDYEIPILTIQIFVENALKYASGLDRPFEIVVFIEKCLHNVRECIHMRISDTGNGFSDEALEMLNSPEIVAPKATDHGIGIFNVRQRLKILYGSLGIIHFFNSKSGGAVVEMYLPIDHREVADRKQSEWKGENRP